VVRIARYRDWEITIPGVFCGAGSFRVFRAADIARKALIILTGPSISAWNSATPSICPDTKGAGILYPPPLEPFLKPCFSVFLKPEA
jgi:hypothetical protein